MKIAVVENEIICAEVGQYYDLLRATGRFRWDRNTKTMRGRYCLITLNALADCCTLPPNIAAARNKMRVTAERIKQEKAAARAVPLVRYPVKAELMQHQIKGANMALLQFGVEGI